MAKKPSKPPASVPSADKIMRQISSTQASIRAAALARAQPRPRGNALKKEGNQVKPPG